MEINRAQAIFNLTALARAMLRAKQFVKLMPSIYWSDRNIMKTIEIQLPN